MDKIEFIDLNKDNWIECVNLHREEDIYIASNLYSIAEAQFYDKANSKAIIADDKMVGYTMYGEDEDDSTLYWIDRLMIGKAYRRNGYASVALRKIADIGKQNGYRKIATSTSTANITMRQVLTRNGFVTDNQLRDNEIVYYINLQ